MSQQSSATELLGYAAASLTTLSFIPQAMRTLSSGDTRGISLSMYAFLPVELPCGWFMAFSRAMAL